MIEGVNCQSGIGAKDAPKWLEHGLWLAPGTAVQHCGMRFMAIIYGNSEVWASVGAVELWPVTHGDGATREAP